jgi:tRNA threonylcarbamoyladenosine biosynthesis protein TsaB
MSLLLSLETSTQSCSVALHKDGVLVTSKIMTVPRSAASQLAVMIEEVMKDSGVAMKELNGIVVTSGPGSYTGLRIGVATAKGVCYALNIPLLSVNTLELMAFQYLKTATPEIKKNNLLLCPMLDARRMEVYCAVFDMNLNSIEPIKAKIIDATSFNELLNNHQVIFFGEGADKCRGMINHTNAQFIAQLIPQASFLGEIGYKKYNQGAFEELVSFEPFYLKDFLIKKPNAV